MTKKKINRTPKVLLLIDHLGVGGAQEIVFDLCKNLKDKIDFEVAFLFNKTNYYNKIKELDINVYPLGTTYRYNIFSAMNPVLIYRLVKLIKRRNYDLIHIHLYVATVLIYFVKFFVRNIKIVNSIHVPRKGWGYPVYWIYRLTKNLTSVFIAEYDSTVKDLKSYGIKSSWLMRINFGSNIADNYSFPKVFKDLKKELKIKPETFVILSVARLSRERQIDKFIKAIPIIKDKIPNIKLVIVGDGPEEEKLKNLTKTLKIQESVLFTGYRKDLPDLFNFCNLYITVYENANPMSVAAIQAWIYEKAVIGYNIGTQSMKEIKSKNPFIISTNKINELADETIRLLNDNKLQAQYGKSGKEFVKKNYSLKYMIQKYDELYNELSKNKE